MRGWARRDETGEHGQWPPRRAPGGGIGRTSPDRFRRAASPRPCRRRSTLGKPPNRSSASFRAQLRKGPGCQRTVPARAGVWRPCRAPINGSTAPPISATSNGCARSRNSGLDDIETGRPLMYQGASDTLSAGKAAIHAPDGDLAIDFEAELAAILGPVPMECQPGPGRGRDPPAGALCNDVSYRRLVHDDLANGFGFFHSKPATSFRAGCGDARRARIAAWRLRTGACAGARRASTARPFGDLDAGADMDFTFADLVVEAARTRRLGCGTILGRGHHRQPPRRGQTQWPQDLRLCLHRRGALGRKGRARARWKRRFSPMATRYASRHSMPTASRCSVPSNRVSRSSPTCVSRIVEANVSAIFSVKLHVWQRRMDLVCTRAIHSPDCGSMIALTHRPNVLDQPDKCRSKRQPKIEKEDHMSLKKADCPVHRRPHDARAGRPGSCRG